MELHHCPKSSGFEEAHTCWLILLLPLTTTAASNQLPDFSGMPLPVSSPHTYSLEPSLFKCVAQLIFPLLELCRWPSLTLETVRALVFKGSYTNVISSVAQAEIEGWEMSHFFLGWWGERTGKHSHWFGPNIYRAPGKKGVYAEGAKGRNQPNSWQGNTEFPNWENLC